MKPKFEDVELEIRRLAREFPDREETCLYLRGDSPCCIVGNALHRLGVPLETLRAYDGDADGYPASDTIEERELGENQWINLVQERQDHGSTWARAVECADAAVFRHV